MLGADESSTEIVILGDETLASRLLESRTLEMLAYYPRAAQAVRFACQHLDKTISLKEVGNLTGMNPSAFSRFFTCKVGISFFCLVRTIRIERAVLLIERSECSISCLAENSGYASVRAFSRAFKNVTGKTPSEYRRRLLGPG